MNTYRAGIDIGSTTVKLVILDENGKVVSETQAGDPEKWYSHNPKNWSDTAIQIIIIEINLKKLVLKNTDVKIHIKIKIL